MPIGNGQIWDITVDDWSTYLCAGVWNHNSGKSQAAAAEVSWMLTGTHPWHSLFPRENGMIYAVGYDEKHIAALMWPKLSREGQIKLIRDEMTQEWRAFRPWQEYDQAYAEKAMPAEPFLPDRLIAANGISWYSKKDDCPKSIRLKNGSELHFYTSKGYPQKGTQIHGWWIDEECEKDGWYAELQARSMRFNGIGFWSATAEIGTPQFFRLLQQSAKAERDGDALVRKFWMLLDENPYISDRSKAEFKASLSERDLRVKYYGEVPTTGLLVYPEFSMDRHVIQSQTIPPSWTRYMIVDPGVSVCAVLFAAVPPDLHGIHIYRELYLRQCSASIFGHAVAQAMGEYRKGFYAFIADMQMGRQHEVGSGKRIIDQYSDALREHGVESMSTGDAFIPGTNDIAARESSFRSWLEVSRGREYPFVRIHDCCSYLIWEIEQQFYNRTAGVVDDRKREKKDNHLVTCAEYLANYDPEYHDLPKAEPEDNGILDYLAEKRARSARLRGGDGISLGPD